MPSPPLCDSCGPMYPLAILAAGEGWYLHWSCKCSGLRDGFPAIDWPFRRGYTMFAEAFRSLGFRVEHA